MFVVKMLTFWVAYSHMIPISLYVMLEVVKLGQAFLIRRDVSIYDPVSGFTVCRNSDLIEEMGQVEFIFSDKTGTLTLNQMVFKECCVNGKVFASSQEVKQQIIKRRWDGNKDDEKTTKMLHEFCHHLSLCHTILVDVNKDLNTRSFQASSPDELALVEGAKWGGYKFAARNSQFVGIENAHIKGKEIYEVLHEFPFDSERKRMSVLLRKRNDK
jgi:phospholipid-transporting ATPase